MRIVVVVVAFLTSACAQSVVVRTDAPAHVVLDGEDLGVVDEGGVKAEVSLGVFPVPYSIERDGVRAEGELSRTRPSWLPNTAGLCGPFIMAPCCVCVGVSCANPQVFASPVFCLLASIGNVDLLFGACYGLCAQLSLAPGWLTVPLGCGGLTLAMVPLLLLGFGALDDEIVLTMPKDPAPPDEARRDDASSTSSASGAPPRAREEMRW